LLIGNKSDLDIRVNREEVEKWCSAKKIPYIETSVKQNKNVHEAFDGLAERVNNHQHVMEKS
jgi:signal recognition particle receptor subunit beta